MGVFLGAISSFFSFHSEGVSSGLRSSSVLPLEQLREQCNVKVAGGIHFASSRGRCLSRVSFPPTLHAKLRLDSQCVCTY